jgi:lipopolysaccharide transport system ATP-binding protein
LATAIKTENLSKIYRLGEIGTGTINRDLERWWARMRGKEDPFLKIGQANDRAVKGDSDIVYSLRDINFEIQQGEAVGIIGKNGAGKSTLLKILSRVTSPTTGKIEIKGRIASLLEVGTGFHPELTGRENIYLNGAILGMRKKEITRKLDEIIDFSGVERYIDTPVKRYSSGMYVRLAFAVAAHLESEILIVDEVLAVGDAEFQKKCLGKMNDVSKSDGRTILFVSHNMAAIKTLCNHLILLKNGYVDYEGGVAQGISNYLSASGQGSNNGTIEAHHRTINNGKVFYRTIRILNPEYINGNVIYFNNPIELKCEIEFLHHYSNILFDVRVLSDDGIELAHTMNTYYDGFYSVKSDTVQYKLKLENTFQPGKYFLTFGVHLSDGITLEYIENSVELNILNVTKDDESGMIYDFKLGYMRPNAVWEII